MNVSQILQNVESDLIEVKGQLLENGQYHLLTMDAVRVLEESVSLLAENILDDPFHRCDSMIQSPTKVEGGVKREN